MQNNSIFSLTRRLLAVFLLVSFVFLAIILRLGYLQIINGEWLQAKACEQWMRELPLKAERGKIFDCNHVTLATNYSTYDVYVRPSMVVNSKEVTLAICDTFGFDFDHIYQKVTDRFMSETLIKMQVPKDVCSSLKDKKLKGILFSENNSRYYPYKSVLTQVLGFTTIDSVGQAGLEAYYNKYLSGVNGYVLEESDVKGVKIDNTISSYIPSIPGLNLNLTIDINIQKFAEDALALLVTEQKPKKASAIIMNPNTGEIVAMASVPNFDLNQVPRNDVAKLMETIKNVNIVDVYEPGSTFKCITMANAIEKGVAHLTDEFYDPGYRIVDGEKIKCWKLTGHGHQTLSEGLCNSCNSVFVDLALRLGKERMYEMFENFGLGSPLGVDFYGESGGIIMNKDTAKVVDVARMGFGQAVATTPLQLISAVCSIVNGGYLYKPYFVKSIVDSGNHVVSKTSPIVIKNTISKDTSEIMKTMMLDVIKQYSGYNAFIAGYEIGGKTGTSQKYEKGKLSGEYIASFVGTFPAKNPDYVILIVVDEPGGISYYGSIAATPYAKKIIENIIQYKDYAPNTDIDADLKNINTMVEMPSLVGMDTYSAIRLLENLGLQVEIAGENLVVLEQFPSPKSLVSINSVVLIDTE